MGNQEIELTHNRSCSTLGEPEGSNLVHMSNKEDSNTKGLTEKYNESDDRLQYWLQLRHDDNVQRIKEKMDELDGTNGLESLAYLIILGELLQKQGSHSEAIRHLKKARVLCNIFQHKLGEQRVLYRLAKSHKAMRDYNRSIVILREAV
jgi:tetratricopeptide (TPR) repeat protein